MKKHQIIVLCLLAITNITFFYLGAFKQMYPAYIFGLISAFTIGLYYGFAKEKNRTEKYNVLLEKCIDLAKEWNEKNLQREITNHVNKNKPRLIFSFEELYGISAHTWFVKPIKENREKIIKGNKPITLDNCCDKKDLNRLFWQI